MIQLHSLKWLPKPSGQTLQKAAPEEFDKQIFREIKVLKEQLSNEEMDLSGKKHSSGRMKKEREHAKTEEGS